MFSAKQSCQRVLILLVEDDYLLRESLSMILAGEGYMVAFAEEGREALQRLRCSERPNLIILDLMLPGMDGWEFRKLQQQDPAIASIPVIVLSAVDGLEEKAAPLNAVECLQKPVETTKLLDSIRRHCHGEAVRS